MAARNDLKMSQNVSMKVAAQVVPFGETNGNLTLARVENCTKGGPIDICTLCRVVSYVQASITVFIIHYSSFNVTLTCT